MGFGDIIKLKESYIVETEADDDRETRMVYLGLTGGVVIQLDPRSDYWAFGQASLSLLLSAWEVDTSWPS